MKTALRTAALAGLLTCLTLSTFASTRSWVPTSGNLAWTDGENWIPSGTPGASDDILITNEGAFGCFTGASFNIQSLVVGESAGSKYVEVTAGTTLAVSSSTTLGFNGALAVMGHLEGGSTNVEKFGALTLLNGSSTSGGSLSIATDGNAAFESTNIIGRAVSNGGRLILGGDVMLSNGASLSNGSTMTVNAGGVFRGDSSTLPALSNSGTLILNGFGNTVPIEPGITNSGGTVTINSGTIDVSGATYKQTSGKTSVAPGASLAGPVENTGGTVSTSGNIRGDVTNGGEFNLATEVDFATVQVSGNFTQFPTGVLKLRIGGVDQLDRLLIGGAAALAGKLEITFTNGFTPSIGQEFPIMTFGSKGTEFDFYTGLTVGDVTLVPQYTPTGLTLAAPVSNCVAGSFCAQDGRFAISLVAKDPRTQATGVGVPQSVNDKFGLFTIPDLTNDTTNPEVFVKVLDGRPINGKFWVFYGSLTDFELDITVTDQMANTFKTYHRDGESACGDFDVDTPFTKASTFEVFDASRLSTELRVFGMARFPASDRRVDSEPEVGCVHTATSLCLLTRFAVSLTARDQRTGNTGTGQTLSGNELFGYFTLPELTSDPTNIEVFVKVLDGTPVNGFYWVFFGGLTDLEYTLRVVDVMTNTPREYKKEANSPCGQFDTSAFN